MFYSLIAGLLGIAYVGYMVGRIYYGHGRPTVNLAHLAGQTATVFVINDLGFRHGFISGDFHAAATCFVNGALWAGFLIYVLWCLRGLSRPRR